MARSEGEDFGMDDVSYYTAAYDVTKKDIPKAASWVKKAKYLHGNTVTEYDPNGQQTWLYRGRGRLGAFG